MHHATRFSLEDKTRVDFGMAISRFSGDGEGGLDILQKGQK